MFLQSGAALCAEPYAVFRNSAANRTCLDVGSIGCGFFAGFCRGSCTDRCAAFHAEGHAFCQNSTTGIADSLLIENRFHISIFLISAFLISALIIGDFVADAFLIRVFRIRIILPCGSGRNGLNRRLGACGGSAADHAEAGSIFQYGTTSAADTIHRLKLGGDLDFGSRCTTVHAETGTRKDLCAASGAKYLLGGRYRQGIAALDANGSSLRHFGSAFVADHQTFVFLNKFPVLGDPGF